MIGGIRADQSISFQAMREKLGAVRRHRPGRSGGRQRRRLHRRRPDQHRLRVRLAEAARRARRLGRPGDRAAAPAARAGRRARRWSCRRCRTSASAAGRAMRSTSTRCRATTSTSCTPGRRSWPRRCARRRELTDVNSDQQESGLETMLDIDRETASRLGLTMSQIDNTLYDAFGQRQVSMIYSALNQYHVVMEVAPRYWQTPDALEEIYVSTAGGAVRGTQATNAVAGTDLGRHDGATAIDRRDQRRRRSQAMRCAIAGEPARHRRPRRHLDRRRGQHRAGDDGAARRRSAHFQPATRRWRSITRASSSRPRSPSTCRRAARWAMRSRRSSGRCARSACRPPSRAASRAPPRSSSNRSRNQPLLILAALLAVYIVLGILYESYIHPITILSTLPSAGVGAVLALLVCRTEFSIIALIGVHPADRHRQEERHHDDRLRPRRRARARLLGRARRSARPACCASGRS